MLQSAVRSACT